MSVCLSRCDRSCRHCASACACFYCPGFYCHLEAGCLQLHRCTKQCAASSNVLFRLALSCRAAVHAPPSRTLPQGARQATHPPVATAPSSVNASLAPGGSSSELGGTAAHAWKSGAESPAKGGGLWLGAGARGRQQSPSPRNRGPASQAPKEPWTLHPRRLSSRLLPHLQPGAGCA